MKHKIEQDSKIQIIGKYIFIFGLLSLIFIQILNNWYISIILCLFSTIGIGMYVFSECETIYLSEEEYEQYILQKVQNI